MKRPKALSCSTGYAREEQDFEWLVTNIPCQAACPAGTDIPGYLAAVSLGKYDVAYRINLEDNIFPATLGRVCARPCEPPCRHGREGLGDPVAICFSKRSAADFLSSSEPVVLPDLYPPSGKRVAIVGSGVAGLAAGRELARYGHRVTVYEMHSRPGGMLNQGIPEFRLPRPIIDREVEQVRLQGVEIFCNTRIGPDFPLQNLVEGFDAVILAAGTFRYNLPTIPGLELEGIEHGMEFLLNTNEFNRRSVSRNVVVIGGGFTAMDCSRTAYRLGAQTTRVAYRRTRNEMLVTPGELEELENEGIPMEYLVGPTSYLSGNGGRRVERIRLVRNQLGELDHSGRRRPVSVEGTDFDLETDCVLLATGQFPDTSWIDEAYRSILTTKDHWLKSGRDHVTPVEKIFAAGDFALGATDLITAIGHAKECARAVDRFLMREERLADAVLIEDGRDQDRDNTLNAVPLQPMPTLPASDRLHLDAEVECGFGQTASVAEAQRCYLCHFKYEIDMESCVYCNQCMEVKPVDNCIVRVGSYQTDDTGRFTGWSAPTPGQEDMADYFIDQDQCIRCNDCVEVCPVDCISVQKVSLRTLPMAELKEATE